MVSIFDLAAHLLASPIDVFTGLPESTRHFREAFRSGKTSGGASCAGRALMSRTGKYPVL